MAVRLACLLPSHEGIRDAGGAVLRAEGMIGVAVTVVGTRLCRGERMTG